MRNGSTKGNKVPFPCLLTNLQTKLWGSANGLLGDLSGWIYLSVLFPVSGREETR